MSTRWTTDVYAVTGNGSRRRVKQVTSRSRRAADHAAQHLAAQNPRGTVAVTEHAGGSKRLVQSKVGSADWKVLDDYTMEPLA